jgi:LacI family transcriptional regulator
LRVNDDKANVTAIKNLLQEQKPDGIFAAVERYALPYQACFELSLSIPNDVKIISFSNLAAYLNPSLTTITQPVLYWQGRFGPQSTGEKHTVER